MCISSEGCDGVIGNMAVSKSCYCINKDAVSSYIWDSFSIRSYEGTFIAYLGMRHAAISKHVLIHGRTQSAVGASFCSFVIEGSTNVGKIPGSIKRTDCTNLQHQHRHAKKNRNAKLHNSRAK